MQEYSIDGASYRYNFNKIRNSSKKNWKNFFRNKNLDAKRDWGHAEDYVEAMHLMLQQEKPRDT